jgi:dsRNA-specific ribonuclease
LEAFIGYIALDIGYDEAYAFVERFVYSKMRAMEEQGVRSYKTQMQEWSQKKYKQIPVYVDAIHEKQENGNVVSYSSQIYINDALIAT